jgi:arabinogalactan endo-1,4-beta-galactosidase
MSINNVYHEVKLIPNVNGMGFDYAIMWENTIVCLCPCEGWARDIANTLDRYQDYYKVNEERLLDETE